MVGTIKKARESVISDVYARYSLSFIARNPSLEKCGTRRQRCFPNPAGIDVLIARDTAVRHKMSL